MAVLLVTDFRVLMKKARALGDAKKLGDAALIEKAQKDHDAYRDLCLKADRMALGLTNKELA